MRGFYQADCVCQGCLEYCVAWGARSAMGCARDAGRDQDSKRIEWAVRAVGSAWLR